MSRARWSQKRRRAVLRASWREAKVQFFATPPRSFDETVKEALATSRERLTLRGPLRGPRGGRWRPRYGARLRDTIARFVWHATRDPRVRTHHAMYYGCGL